MQFHLSLNPKKLNQQISYSDKILLVGTCFAENIGQKLQTFKFDILENPHGILYNPMSICEALESYATGKAYTSEDLFLHNGLWASWSHHGRFSNADKEKCLGFIQKSQERAIERLKGLDWLIITIGTAYVYELKGDGRIVGNCHKYPGKNFEKRLLSTEEIVKTFDKTIGLIRQINPGLKIIFTVSPVRYVRDGIVENNLSKAILLQATHQLCGLLSNTYYFPAYELVIDDLRDYRFFKEDMVHPNMLAINYVWEKFENACIHTDSIKLLQEVKEIIKAREHRPLHPDSEEHKNFKKRQSVKVEELMEKYGLALEDELAFFRQ
jgi:hypothetical protein